MFLLKSCSTSLLQQSCSKCNLTCAGLISIFAAIIQYLLWPKLSPLTWIMFYPAVFFSALFGGLRGGLPAIGVSTLFGVYLFIPPPFTLFSKNIEQGYSTVTFMVISLLISLALENLHRSNAARNQLNELRIADTEQRFTQILDTSNIGIWEWNPLTNQAKLSDLVYTLSGLRRKPQPVGLEDWLAIMHPDDRLNIETTLKQALAQRSEFNVEWRTVHSRHNRPRWLMTRGLPITNTQGELTLYHGMVVDITERKACEIKLLKKERFLADSQRVAHVGSWMIDLKSGQSIWSEEAFRIFGLSPEMDAPCFSNSDNSVFTEFLDLLHPEDCLSVRAWIEACLAGKQPPGLEFRTRLINGAHRWLLGCGQLETSDDGAPLRMIGTVQDISQQKALNNALHSVEARLKSFLDNSLTIAWMKDCDGRYIYLSPNFERKFQVSHNDWLGKTDFDFWPHDVAQAFREDDLRVLNSQLPYEFIEETRTVDNQCNWWLTRKFVYQDINGFRYVGGMAVDITEIKLTEAALRESKSKFQELSQHLETVREEERARIAREIHDDLGSRLTALKMNMSWLDKQLPKNLAECHAKIVTMCHQMDESIQSVKKIINDLRPSILDHLGLFPAIQWTVEEFIQQHKIDCQLSLPAQEFNPEPNLSTAIYRIIQETLTNIAKHAQASQAAITIELSDQEIFVTICDNGRGITAIEEQKTGSFGIQGCKERANHFGGGLTIGTRQGGGTEVKLIMPKKTG